MRDDATTQTSGTVPTRAAPSGPAGSNWAGTYTYRASRVERPSSVEAAAEIVARAAARGDAVRGLGTRHSFSDVADGPATSDGPGILVDLTAVSSDPVIRTDALARWGSTLTVGAGTRYGDVAPVLDDAGFALHNMGSLPHISIAGATATGTHGSGTRSGSLSSAVSALEFIGADGTVRTVQRGEPDFVGSVLHLGLLGIVTRVTLDVEPRYRMRQDAFGPIPWSTFTEHVDEVFAAGTSVCCFTNWDGSVREVLMKSRIPDDAEDVSIPDELFGAPRLPPVPGDGLRTARDGSSGPWWDRLPHFTIDSVPSVGSEVQSEHFVPLRNAAGALDAVHALAHLIQPHLHVAELRTMAADTLPLSPSQGEDVLCIAFTWRKHVAEVAALLPTLEAALAPFDARPHWGKTTSLGVEEIARLYPGLDGFRELVRRVDPGRTFRSGFAERMLGL
ncbi:FAD-binding protein [Curtobacterium sp. RRHDQ10]|uniref:FAD-binding protein n=1 Tax=Curtobacterium phyllosphaerae TaxID=3413379 RepID=UPI003BF0ACFE